MVQAENVLIEGSGHVVLADFGVTAVMEQAESNPKANRRSREVVCRDSASSHEVSRLRVVLRSPSLSGAVVCTDPSITCKASPSGFAAGSGVMQQHIVCRGSCSSD